MRKTLAFVLFGALAASAALADYTVVLKDGRRFQAKEKWKIVQGKAIVELTSGTRLQLNPSLIDAAASEAATKSGLGDVTVLQSGPSPSSAPPPPEKPSLGSLVTLRSADQDEQPERPAREDEARSQSNLKLDFTVSSKFKAAFENVGLFDARLSASAPTRIRIDVTADNEDQVFKAISATSFIFANVPSNYDTVELFMKTNNGGSSGRFQMSLEDARALANKQIEWYDYYIRNVIF
ncbi:MAG: hypothetical protein ACRD2J_11695 [Thermoanaerobaculia bacterium]